MARKGMFEEAYNILKEDKIQKDMDSENFGEYYLIKGKTGKYLSRIYLKVATWFQQCDCRVGTSNQPWGLCKHGIAVIIKKFLEVNKLEIKELSRQE